MDPVDAAYYSFGVLSLLGVLCAGLITLKVRGPNATRGQRMRAAGIRLSALGLAVALIGGFLTQLFLKNSVHFQQSRFACFFAGFALITWGLDTGVTSLQDSRAIQGYLSRRYVFAIVLWAPFLAALAIAIIYLVHPATFIFNDRGLQIQRRVYFAPLLAGTFAGASFLLVTSALVKNRGQRRLLRWNGGFVALIFIGLLRESQILPGAGPLINVLVVFVPFALASMCLCLAARGLLRLQGQAPGT